MDMENSPSNNDIKVWMKELAKTQVDGMMRWPAWCLRWWRKWTPYSRRLRVRKRRFGS
jgi:hypothetical protein